MRKLVIVLMALSLVLVAVSFAAAQDGAASSCFVTSFQTVLAPGSSTVLISTPTVSATNTTSLATPINDTTLSAYGEVVGVGTYAAGGAAGGHAITLVTTPAGTQWVSVGGGLKGGVHGSAFD